MTEDGDIKSYALKVIKIVNQICFAKIIFQIQEQLKKIMLSVPDIFDAKISMIEETCNLTILTVAELVSKLNVYE